MPNLPGREALYRQRDECVLAAVALEIAEKRWDEWAAAGKPPIKIIGTLPKDPAVPVPVESVEVAEDGAAYTDVFRLLVRSSVKSVVELYDLRKGVKPAAIHVRAIERYMIQYFKANRGVSACFSLAARDLRNDAREYQKQIKTLSKKETNVLYKPRLRSSSIVGLDGKQPPRRIVLEDDE